MSDESRISNRQPLSFFAAVFGLRKPVGRRLYCAVGLGLGLFKYAVEALAIYAFTAEFFTPLQFVIPSLALRQPIFAVTPGWLPWAMAIWSIPFLWVALTMTCRRATDAGVSPWNCMWMLFPLVNLIAMIVFALLPSEKPECVDDKTRALDIKAKREDQKEVASRLFAASMGLLIGGLFSLALVLISIYTMHNYGSSLFIGMPIVAGAASAFVFNQPYLRGAWSSFVLGALCVVVGEAVLLLFALEGVICLVMAAPLMIPMGGFGGLLGWGLASLIVHQSRIMLGALVFISMPVFNAVEVHLKTWQEHMVESSVVIDASPEEVWNNVIDFPDIKTPAAWYFRLGVASPLRADIFGEGVGAVRHCEFTTGSFIEPITVWDMPNHLAFDVVDQPEPLSELTPYASINPPHLEHSFRSHRGEFRLVELSDGRTKLIGRTWYSLDMGPRFYWRFWTDEIIHRIHLRVLNHIRETTEKQN